MSSIRSSLLRLAKSRGLVSNVPKRTYASQNTGQPASSGGGFGGLAVAIGAVAVIVPGGLYLINRGHNGEAHNDHEAQKGRHTNLTTVEKSKYPAGRVGGKLQGIDEVVTTKHEDVDSDLPHDALNHPVNREKIEKTMQLKPPTKRVDPIKSVGL